RTLNNAPCGGTTLRATASLKEAMNSAVPGCPLSAGPPFHAYQYVLTEPSASSFLTLLMPLSLTRMFRNPLVEIVTGLGHGTFENDVDVSVQLEFHAGDAASTLGST